ncbi:3-oxoadipyl-CoA thiolase [Symbiobacterium thermophilum]|uniref:Acetyl-CoA acetyltransferase n=1 Tax=Symbiobacterium thermophilum (strain DSM 24528 / JCM 14929 / IAM 14863 / T) TaxID=292459 RepID=Q67RI8_SYMTH|nr:3-oxoadipyl-CoA thiolase [Symbiobacterium thermophilum]BAD39705.1 acetyl-CoA acetyltransferase [Symbiobacterium thermophilum IAM 14863]
MAEAVIVDAVRTPIGRYGGALRDVRPDDLAAVVIRALLQRNPAVSPGSIDDVYLGCANQAGEDNRNVARMAALLAGLPVTVPGVTVNRLCGSGLEAVAQAARAVWCGEGEVLVAGGTESMTRAPFVMAKPAVPWARQVEVYDTTLGWRFVNPRLAERYPPISLGETAERVAERWNVTREDQDRFAWQSQMRCAAAVREGRFDAEIVPVPVPGEDGRTELVVRDEHPRPDITLERLARLRPVFRENGTVTAGNASGINDGASALLIMSGKRAAALGLVPMARIVATAVVGVDPSIMGMGPVPATRKALQRAGLTVDQIDLVELNEAFAAQALACIRELGLDPARVNVNGGAIALGHPLGCSGARILTTLVHEMVRRGSRYGLATMCIGVGQGIAMIVEAIRPKSA